MLHSFETGTEWYITRKHSRTYLCCGGQSVTTMLSSAVMRCFCVFSSDVALGFCFRLLTELGLKRGAYILGPQPRVPHTSHEDIYAKLTARVEIQSKAWVRDHTRSKKGDRATSSAAVGGSSQHSTTRPCLVEERQKK